MGWLADRNGIALLRPHQHVKITHPRHSYYGQTGTIVRIDPVSRRVWVALSRDLVVQAGHRSVEVL